MSVCVAVAGSKSSLPLLGPHQPRRQPVFAFNILSSAQCFHSISFPNMTYVLWSGVRVMDQVLGGSLRQGFCRSAWLARGFRGRVAGRVPRRGRGGATLPRWPWLSTGSCQWAVRAEDTPRSAKESWEPGTHFRRHQTSGPCNQAARPTPRVVMRAGKALRTSYHQHKRSCRAVPCMGGDYPTFIRGAVNVSIFRSGEASPRPRDAS